MRFAINSLIRPNRIHVCVCVCVVNTPAQLASRTRYVFAPNARPNMTFMFVCVCVCLYIRARCERATTCAVGVLGRVCVRGLVGFVGTPKLRAYARHSMLRIANAPGNDGTYLRQHSLVRSPPTRAHIYIYIPLLHANKYVCTLITHTFRNVCTHPRSPDTPSIPYPSFT